MMISKMNISMICTTLFVDVIIGLSIWLPLLTFDVSALFNDEKAITDATQSAKAKEDLDQPLPKHGKDNK